MKQKAGPAAIIAGVVIVLIVVFAAYHFAFARQGPAPSADNAPGYVKARKVKPGEEGAADNSASARPSYGQGYDQRPSAGSGVPSYAQGQPGGGR